MLAPSREAELLTRVKIFKLKYNGYLEEGLVKLVISWFIVAKVVVEEVVKDVRCVWDCKKNGHNKTLWSPGFMLDGPLDTENRVVKRLDVPVREYLESGSPVMDYTQSSSCFIRTQQADIDVGQHFNNFRTHVRDQP